MPSYPAPDSGGNPPPSQTGKPQQQLGSPGGYLPSGKPGGEIVISRTEAAALGALETEPNKGVGYARAARDSGLSAEQIRRLSSRADHARKQGYTLKGGNIVLRPKNYDEETNALLGKDEQPKTTAQTYKKAGIDVPDEEKPPTSMRSVAQTALQQARAVARAKGQSKRPAHTPTRTREAQARWTALHECDGDKLCGPCRARAKAREAAMRGGKKKRYGSGSSC